MEETKWFTKTKLIILLSVLVVVGLIVIFIVVHRNNLKKEYKNFESQLEYAAPNYLIKEKIKLKEEEWREIDIKDMLKQKLITNKRSSDCEGYVIAYGNKNSETDELDDMYDETTDENTTTDDTKEETTDESKEVSEKETKKVSNNITYNAYISCKNIYKTKDYGKRPTDGTLNKEETQSENDTEKPKIRLFGDETITLKVGEKYKELKAMAMDNVDGDISNKIKITGKVNTNVPGEYTIKYTVKDSSKNKATAKRTVIVEDSDEYSDDEFASDDDDYYYDEEDYYDDSGDFTAPIITFNNNSLYQTICAGSKPDISRNGIYGYVARDDVDGNITSRVEVSGDIDVIDYPGVYDLYYDVTDNAGNTTTETKQFTVKDCSSTIPSTSVNVPVSSVSISPNSRVLKIGATFTLTATVNPGNASDASVTWSSSAPGIATVDQNGTVTAIKSGSVTIKAVSTNGKTGACRITVQ